MRRLAVVAFSIAIPLVASAVPAWAKPAGKPAPSSSSSSSVTGTLTVSSTTEGAEVFVDGEKVGTIPLPTSVPLAPGEHTIKVQKPGFAPLMDVFTITRRKDTKMEVELVPVTGIAKITANVEKARVFVDGKFVCEAPCSTDVGVGARAIQVSKGGYKDFFQNVNAVAGQEIALDVKLEELPVGLNPYKPPPPPPPKWYEKWWVWTAAAGGLAVVAVAVAVPVALSQRNPIDDFGASQRWDVTVPALTIRP
jgi:hypothetical protein